MAQNTWFNATVDKAAAVKPDGQDHRNSCTTGTAAAGDMTISYDSAKITSLAIFDSNVRQLRAFAIGSGLK